MSGSFYHSNPASQPYQSMSQNSQPPQSHHHHPRSRRGLRAPSSSSSQNSHRQPLHKLRKASPRVMSQSFTNTAYARDLEAARGFEFEDDEVFCPFNLLTEDDLHVMHTFSLSDRSSLASDSPENSPLPMQSQPNPSFLLSSAANSFQQQHTQGNARMKLHQPMAQRSRNAIPIVDPSGRTSTTTPPSSMPSNPALQPPPFARRW